ncbi:Hypothetical protein HDN1F_33640 [gamma proteobacterium HdN1]|nr:Hypothetical protein HDN1F_33640 [gamma proteobacterium HdN1]
MLMDVEASRVVEITRSLQAHLLGQPQADRQHQVLERSAGGGVRLCWRVSAWFNGRFNALIGLLLLAVLCANSPDVRAAPAAAVEPRPDMRVLIDISGSMKKTDPQNLRVPATKLLLNLAKPGSRMGIWTFGQHVDRLVPLATVDAKWKQAAAREANRISSSSLYTAIGDALDAAIQGDLKPDPAWERSVVLLSDGMVDISKNPADNQREQQRIFQEVVPRLVAGGYKVHAVALSEQADIEFLKRLAEATKGHFSIAHSADQLMHVFVDASDRVNQPLQVPLKNGGFTIDSTITEFTVLAYHRAGSASARLVAPSGKSVSYDQKDASVHWFSDPRFDLVTVQNPEKGQWRVEGDLDPDNRVTVVSNLDLAFEGLPSDVLAGEKLTARVYLSEKGKPIVHPQFLALMDITFTQNTPDGQKFEGKLSRDKAGNTVVPPDGIYQALLGRTLTEGEQQFSVVVDGRTFQRSKRRLVTVHKEALSVAQETELAEGRELQFLVLQPKISLVNPESLDVSADVIDPQGNRSVQGVLRTTLGQLRVNVPSYNGDGVYKVLLNVRGKTLEGADFQLEQGPYEVNYGSIIAAPPVSHQPLGMQYQEDESLDVGTTDDHSTDDRSTGENAEQVADQSAAPEVPEEAGEADEKSEQNTPSLLESFGTEILFSGIAFANLLLIALGVYFYRRMLKRQDAEQVLLMETFIRMKEKPAKQPTTMSSGMSSGEGDLTAETPSAAAASSTEKADQAEAPPASGANPPLFDLSDLDEDDGEATLVRESRQEDEGEPLSFDIPTLEPQETAAPISKSSEQNVSEQPETEEDPLDDIVFDEPSVSREDRDYKITEAPLTLEDDELIEVDDDFDEEPSEDSADARLSAHAASQAAKPIKEEVPLEAAVNAQEEIENVAEAEEVAEEDVDELTRILQEQEELVAQLSALETVEPQQELNETEMTEDQTAAGLNDESSETKKKAAKPQFPDDDFMLDNPNDPS